jgi:hypothetical protein
MMVISPRQRRLVALILVGVAAAGILIWRGGWGGATNAGGSPPDRLVPEDTRIRVEVLNATPVRGLARRATFHLRDLGFDVVRFAGDPAPRDSTLVIDRSSHPEWAALVSRAFGGARVESRPDSSRYVDVTVLIGASWRPPAQPFYP